MLLPPGRLAHQTPFESSRTGAGSDDSSPEWENSTAEKRLSSGDHHGFAASSFVGARDEANCLEFVIKYFYL